MKEVTQIITCEITSVIKSCPEDTLPPMPMAEAVRRGLAKLIKTNLRVDDVVITNIQEFVREEADHE